MSRAYIVPINTIKLLVIILELINVILHLCILFVLFQYLTISSAKVYNS